MAVFQHIPPDQLRAHFRYRGWFLGLVPVYVGEVGHPQGPNVAVRNGVPEWALDLAHVLWGAFVSVAGLVNPMAYQAPFPIKITGRLDGRPFAPGELE